MVGKNNWTMGQSRRCTASSGFHIPPCQTYFCPDLYFENWTVFIHSPVFCFPAKAPCNTCSYCQRCWFFMMCVSVCLVVPRLIHLRQRCPNMWRSFNFTKIQATVPHTILCLIIYMTRWENLFEVDFELAVERRELWFFSVFHRTVPGIVTNAVLSILLPCYTIFPKSVSAAQNCPSDTEHRITLLSFPL